jgi:hypothetical protein
MSKLIQNLNKIELAPRSNKPMSYDEAFFYCRFCNHGGYNDWRLQTLDEKKDLMKIHHARAGLSWHLNDPVSSHRWYAQPVRNV